MEKMIFSEAIEKIRLSGAAKYFGRSNSGLIDFSIGEPKDPPPESAVDAYIAALKSKSSRYAPVQGLPELRERIAEKLSEKNKIPANPEEILVTSGASEAIAFSIMSLVGKGDEVIVAEPSYPIMAPMVRFCGGKPVSLMINEGSGFSPDIEQLKGLIRGNTRMIMINTPHNPTGTVFGKPELRAISEIFGGPILVDEVYENFTYGTEHHSLASIAGSPENIITVNSFSKTYCMCGYRVGYLHARKDAISQMLKLKLCISTCTSNPAQKAAIAALEDKKFPAALKARFDERRRLMVGGLKAAGLPFVEPKGAFYAFPDVTCMGGGEKAFELFLGAGVLSMPGSVFHESCANNVRLSFVSGAEEIKKGIERLKGLASISGITS